MIIRRLPGDGEELNYPVEIAAAIRVVRHREADRRDEKPAYAPFVAVALANGQRDGVGPDGHRYAADERGSHEPARRVARRLRPRRQPGSGGVLALGASTVGVLAPMGAAAGGLARHLGSHGSDG